MKYSVIVPIYGVEAYIERCARSLFNQEYSDVEYIFINDCTKDRSIDILKNVISDYSEVKDRIKIINNPRNLGIATTRNIGIRSASGDYIIFVDSDDYLSDHALLAIDHFVTNSKNTLDIVLFNHNIVSKSRVLSCRGLPQDFEKKSYLKSVLHKKLAPSLWGKVYRRNFYIDANVSMIDGADYAEDLLIVPRLIFLAKHVGIIPEALYYYSLRDGSYTSTITEDAINSEMLTHKVLEAFFTENNTRMQGIITKADLTIMKLRSKVNFSKMSNDVRLYEKIAQIYPELTVYASLLNVFDRFLLFCLEHRLFNCLKIAIATWRTLKKDL